ncbi:MAG: TonB C-terminal domain-containing protein, partial [Bacteriovoracaceae bacterium]
SMLKPQIPSSQIEKIKKNKKTKETEKSFKDLGPKTTESQKVRQVQINNQVTQKVLKKYEPHGLIDENVLNSDFNLKPELPKGIPEDELNSIEKIYFSFQKRMFVQYLNTFITTYNKQKQRRPLLKSELQNERHRLSARVIFDKEGNIIAIKVIKSSPNDDVHDLFEQTLRNIQKVPNPPKDFINKDDEFVIYYSLNINK